MINEELRKQLDELDAEFADPEPVVETQEELLARLEDLEDKEPEVEEEPPPPVYASGTFGVRFTHAIVRRDEQGRVMELIEEKKHTILHRDIAGRIIEIEKIEEVEQMTEDPEEGSNGEARS
jgi:hypothetical protein